MVLSSSLSMCSLFNGKIFYAADQASNLGNSHVTCRRLGALHSASQKFLIQYTLSEFKNGGLNEVEKSNAKITFC